MPRIPRAPVLVALLSLPLVPGQLAPLAACDVPVCEYALVHWPRQEYTLYYLHDGAEAKADARANELLRKVAAGKVGHANLRFTPVDASLDPERLAPDARYVLELSGGASRPRHILMSPKGRAVFSGHMTVQDARELLASPKTAALADMLCRGLRGVMVVMTDGDEAQSAAALETARGVIDSAQDARVVEDARVRMGLLEVSRQDPSERWLVRQLLAVEADLGERRGPMVFGAYGRGHVTEAYLGKGITASNLAELAKFMNGPCTCEIKAANLGVDLVSDWDWEAHVSGTAAPPRPVEPTGYVTFAQ